MAKNIFFQCRCGRTLRVANDRAGTLVRCWDCRNELTAPLPDLRGRLAGEMSGVVRSALGPWIAYCLLAAVLTTGLLLLGRIGLALVAVLIGAAGYYGRDALIGTAKRFLVGTRRHPLAMLCIPLVLALGLVAMEATLVGVAYGQDWFRYLVLDITPRSGAAAVLGGEPHIGGLDFYEISDAQVFRIYAHGLRRGYALTWTIPASLLRGLATRPNAGYPFVNPIAWDTWVDPFSYLGFRAFCTVAAMTSLLSLVLVKARWINIIGSLEARYLASNAR